MGFISNLWVKLGLKDDDFSKGLNRAASKTKSFSNQAGRAVGDLVARFASLTTAVALVGKAIGDAVRTIMDFERANSNLASILGTNKKNIKELTDAAEDLGRRTEFTATQVTELQTELAKLGFNKQEILNSEKAILKFASAVDTDLASAAAFAGATLRSFGYEADRMPDLLDVMAAACTNSALDFEKLSTALPIVGATAKAFGMDVKQVTALLGVLANKGIDASTAATSLRNIFLDAVKSNSKLAAATGMSLKTYQDVFAALKKLAEEGGNLEDIAGAGTTRTATQIAALASSIPEIEHLTDVFLHSGGVLEKMYKEKVDNATGAVKNWRSAVEGIQLVFRDADSLVQKFIQTCADLLNKITDLIKSPFWKSGFWAVWKKSVSGAITVTTSKLGPLIQLLGNIRKLWPGKKDKVSDTPDTHDVVFGEDDPNFIGPVLPKVSTTTVPDYDPKKDPLHKMAVKLANQVELDNMKLEELMKKREEIMLQNEAVVIGLSPFAKQLATSGDAATTGIGDLAGKDDYYRRQMEQAERLSAYWDEMRYAAENLTYAIQDGLIAAFDELADVIAGVEGADFGTVAKALLEPLADMAVTMGTMIMTSGEAIEALKASLTTFFGGNAIVAGAALVGIGVAMKAGLSALAKGGSSSAAGTVSTGEYSSGSAEDVEMTIHVEGRLKGSDIVLAGQRATAAWSR